MTAAAPQASVPPGFRRRARRWAGHLLFAAAVVVWGVFLRPDVLGGSASYVLVSGHSMQPRLQTGDLVITQRKDTYARGDVIAYRVPKGEPGAGARVIHRISGGSAREGFRTRGDNREEADIWRPRPRDIEGRLWLRLPKLGTLMLMLSTPIGLAAAAGLLTFLAVGGDTRSPRRHARRSDAPTARARAVKTGEPVGSGEPPLEPARIHVPAQPASPSEARGRDVDHDARLAASALCVVIAVLVALYTDAAAMKRIRRAGLPIRLP